MDDEQTTPATIAVTGGSSGLGAAVVDAIAEGGRRPLVIDRRPPAREVDHLVVDLADRRAAERAIRDHKGALETVVAYASGPRSTRCNPVYDGSTLAGALVWIGRRMNPAP